MPPEPPAAEPPASKQSALRDQTYRIALGTAIGLLAIATVIYRILEDWSWVDSFYFSSVAASTVGFGDLHPTTDATKLFTVFYIFAGMSLLGAVLNERLRRHTEQRAAKKRY